MNHWWRAYNEAVNDPKLQLLSDALFRAWFNLMCIASANDGRLPDLTQLAFIMRMKPEKVTKVLEELQKARLLDKTQVGFEPHNWGVRQYKSDVTDPTNAVRQKRYRERHRNGNNAVTASVTDKRPEADTEQIQSRAEQTRAAVTNLEKVLRTDLAELLGPSRTLSLDRTSVWLSKGYSSSMITEVIGEVIARGTEFGSLNYFDAMLAERHATQFESSFDMAAKRNWDSAAKLWKSNGRWPKGHGPDPDSVACQCPADVLAKYDIAKLSLQRMDA